MVERYIANVKMWVQIPPELYENSSMVERYIVTVKMWVRVPFLAYYNLG